MRAFSRARYIIMDKMIEKLEDVKRCISISISEIRDDKDFLATGLCLELFAILNRLHTLTSNIKAQK